MGSRVILPTVSSRSARHLARSYHGSTQDSFSSGFDEFSEPLLRRTSFEGSVHYQSIYDSSEFNGGQRNRIEVMRKRLKSHFMNPYQKYKHRGRKPWKLLLQLLKLIMVTVQVNSLLLFGYVINFIFLCLTKCNVEVIIFLVHSWSSWFRSTSNLIFTTTKSVVTFQFLIQAMLDT